MEELRTRGLKQLSIGVLDPHYTIAEIARISKLNVVKSYDYLRMNPALFDRKRQRKNAGELDSHPAIWCNHGT